VILADTNIWSAALRRSNRSRHEEAVAEELHRLIVDDLPVGLPGVVLQEVLSGVRFDLQFTRLQRALAGFPVFLAETEDYVEAAKVNNRCRSSGIATTLPDCLIAAQALRLDASLWSLDLDFEHMAKHCGVRLYGGGLGLTKQ
jgi:predicted nucleic acid-binding protein